MKTLISCAYNMDNCCVELRFSDGSMIAIDTIAVENEVARNMYERSELDYLIYNDPIGYADLILNGNPETYLKLSRSTKLLIKLIARPFWFYKGTGNFATQRKQTVCNISINCLDNESAL